MEFRNPSHNSFGGIDCEINHTKYGWIPFTCHPEDKGAEFDTAALFEKMKPFAASYVGPTQEEIKAQLEFEVRRDRDRKLAREVDPIAGNALRWSALTDKQRQAWADYRQLLLDVPQQSGFPENVIWPSKP